MLSDALFLKDPTVTRFLCGGLTEAESLLGSPLPSLPAPDVESGRAVWYVRFHPQLHTLLMRFLQALLRDIGAELPGTARASANGKEQADYEAALERALMGVDLVFHEAGIASVPRSLAEPVANHDVNATGTLKLLHHAKRAGVRRVVYAASSATYGDDPILPKVETMRPAPMSPYAVSKLFAYWMCVNYREAYGMFICNGILFNHESPRRGENFVTRKITRGVAAIKLGLQKKLALGNLEAKRDWGYAKDYVQAMWQMMQLETPDDYVIATGETHTVREFCELAFSLVGLDYRDHVVVDSKYLRPTEVDLLIGNATKARERFGWKPTTGFADLVKLMVDADLALVQETRKP